jgi:hypothetical protein
MIKVKTLTAFETKAHRVISRGPDEVIRMPEEDLEEVRDKVKVLDRPQKDKMMRASVQKGEDDE